MSKREYGNYNVLDDDIKKDQVQEVIKGEIEHNKEQQDKKQEETSQDNLMEQTSNQSVNQMTEEIGKQENHFNKQTNENEENKLKNTIIKTGFFYKDNQTSDSVVPEYKRFYQQKERSNLFKWCMRFARMAILVMLLPLWALIALGILLVIGGVLFAIAGFIGTGVFILGVVCFISSQVSLSIIALGISIAITSIAFGGIILIIFSALIKWVIELVRKYKRPRIKAKNKEVI